MKSLSRVILLTLSLGFFAIVLSFVPRHPVAAATDLPSLPVKIINTPLPVTGTVNAAVTGTVGAQQTGAWNVGINNTPTVNANITNAAMPVSGSVSVSNLPTSQNVSFNGTAQPVTLTSQLVTLVCAMFVSNICTDLERVGADGTLTPFTAPPSGFDLVVTDFVWKAASVTPGQVAFATLHHQLTSPPHDVVFSTAVATPDSAAVAESRFTTGLQFSDVPVVFVSGTPNVAILQGYLVTH